MVVSSQCGPLAEAGLEFVWQGFCLIEDLYGTVSHAPLCATTAERKMPSSSRRFGGPLLGKRIRHTDNRRKSRGAREDLLSVFLATCWPPRDAMVAPVVLPSWLLHIKV